MIIIKHIQLINSIEHIEYNNIQYNIDTQYDKDDRIPV